ncbi:MAG: hypothetical protein JWQ97_1179, partial [Phenylobacterium sp.]|nr:hypothetical protein [Phenylobacterium sp.]
GDPAKLRALTRMGVYGFVNMPVVAYLFAPLALMPLPVAAIVFYALGLALTAAAWAMLARLAKLDLTDRWLLALLFVANGPLEYSLKEDNTSHVVLFGLAAALILLRAGRSAAAGAVLAAAAILKPPLLLFGGFFLLRRDGRGVAAFSGTLGAVAALSLAIFGWDDNLRWFELCIVKFSHLWLAAFNVQSIPGFLFRLQAAAGLLTDWHPRPPPAGLQLPAQLCVMLVLALAGLAALRAPAGAEVEDEARRSRRRDLKYLLVLTLTVIVSPLSWSHYYAWLLAPMAFFLGGRRALPAPERALGWAAIALVTPLARYLVFPDARSLLIYKDIAVSHLLFGGLLWFGLVAWRLAREDGLVAAWIRRGWNARKTAQMTWRRPRSAGTVS